MGAFFSAFACWELEWKDQVGAEGAWDELWETWSRPWFGGMPRDFEVRWWRFSPTGGWGTRLIDPIPDVPGGYTAVTPKMEVSTIDISARSGVSVHTKGGVTYTAPPELDALAKKRAKQKSKELIQRGILKCKMGAYKPPGEKMKWLYKMWKVFYSLPMAAFAVVSWAWGSYLNMMMLLAISLAGYRFVDVSGVGEYVIKGTTFVKQNYETFRSSVESGTSDMHTYEA